MVSSIRRDRIARLVADLQAVLDLGDDMLGLAAERVDRAGDLVGRLAGLAGENLDLARHYREAAPGLARARRLDCGVKREDVGGLGDLVDVVRALLDLAHRRREAGDMLGERVDQLEQLADLAERGADMIRALRELLERALREQSRFLAGLRDLILVLVERGDRAEQRGVLGTQLLRRREHLLDQARYVGAAQRDFAAAVRNAVDAPRSGRLDDLMQHA